MKLDNFLWNTWHGTAVEKHCARLETKEGEKKLYRLARQRDRAGEDVQHVRVIKDENVMLW